MEIHFEPYIQWSLLTSENKIKPNQKVSKQTTSWPKDICNVTRSNAKGQNTHSTWSQSTCMQLCMWNYLQKLHIPLDWDTGFKSLLIPISLVKYLIKGEEKEQKRKKDILNTPV